jgi:hypothetical protein
VTLVTVELVSLWRNRVMEIVVDYSNYEDCQGEWGRALTALARRMDEDKARDLAKTAALALKRTISFRGGTPRRLPLPKA